MARPSTNDIVAERVRQAVRTTFGSLYHYSPQFDAYRAVHDVIAAENVNSFIDGIADAILDEMA